MDQVLSHKFFNDFAPVFNKFQTDFADILKRSLLTEIGGKESIASAVHKTEQRLKEEQKLVRIKCSVMILSCKILIFRSKLRRELSKCRK